MKKILAIILVVAMVLVPLTALAGTITTPAPITITEVGAKGGKLAYFDQVTEAATTPAMLMSGSDYYLRITAPANYRVKTVAATAAGLTVVQPTGTGTFGDCYGIEDLITGNGGLTITYEANKWAIVPQVVGALYTDVLTGFGAVTMAKAGDVVTFTANIKNAYCTGVWFAGDTAIDGTEDFYISGKGTRTLKLSYAGLVAEFVANEPVTIGAQAQQVGAVVAADVAANCQGYGTVTVQWLSANSVKVSAAAAKGCKFIGWADVSPIPLLQAAVTLPLDYASPVLYITNLSDLNLDNISLEAYFVVTSGDFTTGTSDATGGKSDNPKTGDTSNIALWTIVGIIALGGVALASKKVFSK